MLDERARLLKLLESVQRSIKEGRTIKEQEKTREVEEGSRQDGGTKSSRTEP